MFSNSRMRGVEQWVAITRDAGRAIADPDADVTSLYDRLNELATRFSSSTTEDSEQWTVYGALITTVRHIAVIIDDIASAREARETTREASR